MVYGTDLTIDFVNNDISFTDNNFKLISEKNNLEQAIKTLLLTTLGSLRTHANFGSRIYEVIGLTQDEISLNTAGSYVYQALEKEARIKEIQEITLDFRKIEGKSYLAIFIQVLGIDEDVPLNLVVSVEI